MPLLKNVTPKYNMSKSSVAIVGSSGALKGTDYGSIIDSYNEVIRFNRAPTDGYESKVGKKTTLRVANTHVFRNRKSEDLKKWPDRKWGNQPQNFIADLRNSRIMMYHGSFSEEWEEGIKMLHSSNTRFRFFHKKFIANEIYDHKRHPEKDKERLISIIKGSQFSQLAIGVGFILVCVSSGLKPHIFGFDTANRPRDHYWEFRPPTAICHDVSLERKVLLKLEKMGKIVIHR